MKLDEHTHALLNLLLYGIMFKREQLPHDEATRIFEHFVLPELVAKKLNKRDVQQTDYCVGLEAGIDRCESCLLV
jgi:hypothetical protein